MSRNLAHRTLTALIAPGAHALWRQSGRRFAAGQQSGGLRSALGAGCGGADLRGVNLSGAKLNHADLRDTKLGPLLITGRRLLPARLDNAQARYADFRGADLRRARHVGLRSLLCQSDRRRPARSEIDGREFSGAKLPMRIRCHR